ncbi:porin [[Haemophilus] ducreyi]|uniref:porin n=1 Tax=Haemophilus ducreyi TaxID=730 RepID=UPI0007CDF77C|nr:porin [[Haemophilus] ducreyi]ANF61351.1 hypothetical protein A6037_00455 [[Haemophilus] ducreyi]ANF67458.1 hypothetical protein A6041_02205 [[Haemophilus] ducreyi]ANF68665.1 hypothetical protein A6042_01130 [[Haemophilus] ducreyi]SEV95796.1 Outer membrane protein (porin) [[Haemophilus] ducreyi]VEG83578.1 outer membrane protein P2-like protein [[Haemophilus] ducreyi]
MKMKKTLVALAVATFSVSASAAVVYEADGTKIEFDGSVRLLAEQNITIDESQEIENIAKIFSKRLKQQTGEQSITVIKRSYKKLNNYYNQQKTKRYRNAGSRLGVTATQDLDDGFYAFGRLEIRANKTNNENQFGRLYIKRAFAGLGQKDVGQLTFGRQLTIADDSYQTDSYEFGIVPSYIASDGNSVIRYDYTGVDGLVFSANYNLSEKQNAKGEALDYKLKNAYGVGFTYQANLKNNKAFYLNTAYGRSNYDNTDKTQAQTKSTKAKHYRDGYQMALGYKIGNFKLVSDFGYANEKSRNEERRVKTTSFYAAPGLQFQFTQKTRLYGNYLFENSHIDDIWSSKSKSKGFLLGIDYTPHKNVLLFVEGKMLQMKTDYVGNSTKTIVEQTFDNDTHTITRINEKELIKEYSDKTEKSIGIGIRIYW